MSAQLRAQLRKQEVWRHNSFLGHARMMQAQLAAILSAPTATKRAKQCVLRMLRETDKLERYLHARKPTRLGGGYR